MSRYKWFRKLKVSDGIKVNSTKGISQQSIILLVLLIFLAVFVLYPVGLTAYRSLFDEGDITISFYQDVLTSSATAKAFKNTLQLVFLTLVVSWGLGGAFAFLKVKTNFRFKGALDTISMLAFGIPPYILSISWIELMSRGGYFHRFLRIFMPNLHYQFDVYSIEAAALIMGLHLYPLVYYGLSSALKMMDGSLEQGAAVCGLSNRKIISRIVLPLTLPALFSTGLLVMTRTMANFAVTAQLAMPSGKEVLTTRIFAALSDLNMSVVAVLSMLLVTMTVVIYLIMNFLMRKNHYHVHSTNSSSVYKYALGKWRWIVEGLWWIFVTFTIIIPYASIILSSFLKRWGLKLQTSSFTFNNYQLLFGEEGMIFKPLVNSITYGVIATTAAIFISTFLVYISKYYKGWITRITETIAQLPLAFPNMILAVAATFAWINEPLKLYGTKWIIIFTYIILFIPISMKQINGAAKNMGVEGEMAARTMGVTMPRRYFSIYLPQIKDGVIAAYIMCFMIALREVPIALLLYSVGTGTLGVLLFTIQSNSYGLEMTSAVAVVVMVISLVGNLMLRKLGRVGG